MKTRRNRLRSALLLTMSCMPCWLAAHESTVQQDGSDNAATVTQTGNVAPMSVEVSTQGSDNTVEVDQQDAGGSGVTVDQINSHGNLINVEQVNAPAITAYFTADIDQTDTDSAVVTVRQEFGFLSKATILQTGADYSEADVEQTGAAHEAEITQSAAYNFTDVDQAGAFQNAIVEQSGAGIGALPGESNLVEIRQDGDGNMATAYQSGGYGNFVYIQQDN